MSFHTDHDGERLVRPSLSFAKTIDGSFRAGVAHQMKTAYAPDRDNGSHSEQHYDLDESLSPGRDPLSVTFVTLARA
jgi:hypothetical protein